MKKKKEKSESVIIDQFMKDMGLKTLVVVGMTHDGSFLQSKIGGDIFNTVGMLGVAIFNFNEAARSGADVKKVK